MPYFVTPLIAKGSFSSKPQPTLSGDGIKLRPWAEGDVPAVVAAYADPDIQRWHLRSMNKGEALEWINSRNRQWSEETGVSWAIDIDGQAVGRMELREPHLHNGVAEIAYWLLPNHRGQGLVPKALDTASQWAWTVGLHRLYLLHSVENPQSCRVATKCGFEVEGTSRSAVRHADGWHDMHLHARIAPSA